MEANLVFLVFLWQFSSLFYVVLCINVNLFKMEDIDNLVYVNEVIDILIKNKCLSYSFTICDVLVLCLPVELSNLVECAPTTEVGTRHLKGPFQLKPPWLLCMGCHTLSFQSTEWGAARMDCSCLGEYLCWVCFYQTSLKATFLACKNVLNSAFLCICSFHTQHAM